MKKRILFFTITLIALFAINTQSFSQTKTSDTKNPNAAVITFEKTVYDYGTIANGANPNFEFKFKNTGKEPLIISNCQASCGCTIPVCPKEPILPGRTGIIKGTYATTRTGKINKTITVTSNAKNSPIPVSISGEVLAPVTNNTGTPEKPVNTGSTPVNQPTH
jgi:hypothetical protein